MTLTLDQGRTAVKFANSFNRLSMVLDLAWQMETRDWLALLGEEWDGCDNTGEHLDALWESPFCDAVNDPALRQHLMTAAERRDLARLPAVVEVYRGCYAENQHGLSWSLDRAIASHFPHFHRYRQAGQPLLVRARIARGDIIALKSGRDEAEIIAHRPKHISTSHLPRQAAFEAALVKP